jgi:hypothetical protein
MASERVQSQLIHEKMLEIFNKEGIMKTKTLRLILSLAGSLSWQIPLQAQWIQTNGPYGGRVTCFAVSGTNLFAGACCEWWYCESAGGVFLSTDNGESWTGVSIGLPNTSVNTIAINGTNLFAGTGGNGVWRRPLSEMILTSVEEPSANRRPPGNFSLEQNYPNPFNPTTTIAFHLPASSFVTLKVFNSAGQEVASLVDRLLPAGNHRTEWNASSVPSGIYCYRIQAGSYSETKKLIVMR